MPQITKGDLGLTALVATFSDLKNPAGYFKKAKSSDDLGHLGYIPRPIFPGNKTHLFFSAVHF